MCKCYLSINSVAYIVVQPSLISHFSFSFNVPCVDSWSQSGASPVKTTKNALKIRTNVKNIALFGLPGLNSITTRQRRLKTLSDLRTRSRVSLNVSYCFEPATMRTRLEKIAVYTRAGFTSAGELVAALRMGGHAA